MGLDFTVSRRSPALQVTVAGVPVRLFASFWFSAVVVIADRSGAVPGIAWAAILLAVVLAQEAAHAAALKLLGYSPRIWVHYLGGETFVAKSRPVALGKLIGAYLAGPIAGFALAGAAGFAQRFAPAAWLHALAGASGAWAACNLLPIEPLAGGKILRALLTRPLGARVSKATHGISLAVIFGLVPLVVYQAPSLTAFALLFLGAVSNIAVLWDALREQADAALTTRLREGYAALREPDGAARAHQVAIELEAQARSPGMRGHALELRAWAHLTEKNPKAAERVLMGLRAGTIDLYLEGSVYFALAEYRRAATVLTDALERNPTDAVGGLLARALLELGRADEAMALGEREWAGPHVCDMLMAAHFYAGRYPEALKIGERWWSQEQNPRCAFNLACTFARLGRLDEGGAWIGRAVDAGFRDLAPLDEDPDLEPLRKLHAFHQARARLTSLGRPAAG